MSCLGFLTLTSVGTTTDTDHLRVRPRKTLPRENGAKSSVAQVDSDSQLGSNPVDLREVNDFGGMLAG
jgi:hypothetical protein